MAYFVSIIMTGLATGIFLALLLLRFMSGSLLTAMGDACGGIFAAGHGFLAASNWNYLLVTVIFAALLSQLAFLFGGGSRLFRLSHKEKQRRQVEGMSCPALKSISREKWAAHLSLMPGDERLDALTVGLFQPRIVFSKGLVKELDGRELAAIAAHEEAHRSARDNILIVMARTVVTTLFYLPGPALALTRMRNCLERAADQSAASASGDRLIIAEVLARLAGSKYSDIDPNSSLVTAVRGSGDLVERLEELVGDQKPCGRQWGRLTVLIAGMAVVFAIFASSAMAATGTDQREAFICFTQHTQRSEGLEDICLLDHPNH